MPSIKITKQLFDKLDYDTDMATKNVPIIPITAAGEVLTTPTVMVVFSNSDLNAAAYHLAKSLESPFAADAIAVVLVEEAARADFIGRLKSLLKPLPEVVAQHAERQRALTAIVKYNWDTVLDAALGPNSPTLVCDVTHEQLGVGATGLATLHTFRTAKEAISLCGKESLKFANATIWHANQACAYEIAINLACSNYFLNCNGVSMEPLKLANKESSSCALVEQSYHYEILLHKGVQKNIVFPIGTIFAN